MKDVDKEGKLYNNSVAYIKTYNSDLFSSSFITKIEDIGHFADNKDYQEVYKIYFDMQVKGGYMG